MVEDFGFIEAEVKSDLVKSGRSKNSRGHTDVATGVPRVPWAETWLKQSTLVRRLMQAGWAASSPSCAEADECFRAFATGAGWAAEELQAKVTHTPAGRCSSRGAAILARGMRKAREAHEADYARVLAGGKAEPLDSLAEVREGTFDPDDTRSGRRGHFGRFPVRVGSGRIFRNLAASGSGARE